MRAFPLLLVISGGVLTEGLAPRPRSHRRMIVQRVIIIQPRAVAEPRTTPGGADAVAAFHRQEEQKAMSDSGR